MIASSALESECVAARNVEVTCMRPAQLRMALPVFYLSTWGKSKDVTRSDYLRKSGRYIWRGVLESSPISLFPMES